MTRNFFAALFHAEDKTADSIVLGGLVALAALVGLQALDTALGHGFSPVNFGGAAGAILAAIGAGKRVRDGASGDVRS